MHLHGNKFLTIISVVSGFIVGMIWILIQASLWSMYIKSAHNWRLNDYICIYMQCRTVTDRGSDACVAAPLHYLWWLMKSSTTGKHGMTCYYRLKQSATNRFPFYFLNNVEVQRSTVRAPCGAVNISWLWAGLPRVVWLMLPKRRRIDEESVRRCGCVSDGRCSGPSWRFQPRMKQLHISPAQTGKLWILWIMCLAHSQTGWSDGAAVKGVQMISVFLSPENFLLFPPQDVNSFDASCEGPGLWRAEEDRGPCFRG